MVMGERGCGDANTNDTPPPHPVLLLGGVRLHRRQAGEEKTERYSPKRGTDRKKKKISNSRIRDSRVSARVSAQLSMVWVARCAVQITVYQQRLLLAFRFSVFFFIAGFDRIYVPRSPLFFG
jgi:hypothetical protein